MQFSIKFILAIAAFTGTVLASPMPNEPLQPGYHDKLSKSYDHNHFPYKKDKDYIFDEHKKWDPYWSYGNDYSEWTKKGKEYTDYDKDYKKYDKYKDEYEKIDYDAYYDNDIYAKESEVEVEKAGYECCYGYDKGAKYDKGYGYSKGYNNEYETETEVKDIDNHGWKDFDKKEKDSERKYWVSDKEDKDQYNKDYENWKKWNEYYKPSYHHYRHW